MVLPAQTKAAQRSSLVSPSGRALQTLRAVEVLERIATPDARKLLASLARGEPRALLTREAVASLQRLMAR